MKTTSKTMVTLSKLSESMKAPSSESNERKRNIVEFHPEELDEFTPLKPEEADDCKLAAFLDDHDFSFLFESTARENQRVNSSSFRKLGDSRVQRHTSSTSTSSSSSSSRLKHRIPVDTKPDNQARFIAIGSKRARVACNLQTKE
jgi:hypothetical protein